MKTSIMTATIRGYKDDSLPNQDFIEIFENEDVLLTVVSDGLGSSKNSLQGAKIACHSVVAEIKNFLSFKDLKALGSRIKDNWKAAINEEPGDIKDYRTTNSFVAVFKKNNKIIVGQLGDVLVSIRLDGLFRFLKSTQKDFSNETDCLGGGSNVNYHLSALEFGHSFDFLIASDGIGDELQPEKMEMLHDYFIKKYEKIDPTNRNEFLMKEIKGSLNEKNNDDKSMVFVWSNNS